MRDEKGMVVFSLWSPRFPATEIDVFVDAPFDFDQAWNDAVRARVGSNDVVVVSLSALIAMKERTGRPVDQQDVEALRRLAEEQDD